MGDKPPVGGLEPPMERASSPSCGHDSVQGEFAKNIIAAMTVPEPSKGVTDAKRAKTTMPTVRSKRKAPPSARRHERKSSLRHANSVELLQKKRIPGSGPQMGQEAGIGGREGRQFTVANVGNNGRIFLKPTVRPAQQRHQPPTPAFPQLASSGRRGPSSSSSVAPILSSSALQQANRPRRSSDATLDTLWSGTRSPRTTPRRSRQSTDQNFPRSASPPPIPRIKQQRAQSFSTIGDANGKSQGGGQGLEPDRPALGVGISRGDGRPQTADRTSAPALEVSIPHYRLGTPRFSVRGTAFLNSVYTQASTNDELRSSAMSQAEFDRFFTIQSTTAHPSLVSRWNTRTSSAVIPEASNRLSQPKTHHSGEPIEPSIYDGLTFPPQADHASTVRFAESGAINAATPSRLVAQITSPNFLDYDLLSDFFLTYRLFMSSYDLVSYLMARLHWAALRHDEVGKIVRVRAFVAMRHWLLNYFVDDFVPNYSLRENFCDALNGLCRTLKEMRAAAAPSCKINGELKRCWRRTCALYWDMEESKDGPADDIVPGGPAGIREGHLNVTSHIGRPPIDAVPPKIASVLAMAAQSLDAQADGRVDDDADQPRPSDETTRARNASMILRKDAAARGVSLESDLSIQVMSCSFLPKGFRHCATSAHHHTGAHPVRTKQSTGAAPPHLQHTHKRAGSFSDALRDRRADSHVTDEKPKGPQLLMAFPYCGSLIRGNMLPPTPTTDVSVAPGTPTEIPPGQAFPFDETYGDSDSYEKPSNTSGPMMRKLFGSMRRALGSSGPSAVADGSHANVAGATKTTSTSKTTANASPLARNPNVTAASRTDLLSTMAVESFQAAGHDDAVTNEQMRRKDSTPKRTRPNTGLTMSRSSKSIVIINDTEMPPLPTMSGAIQHHREIEIGSTQHPTSDSPTSHERDLETRQHRDKPSSLTLKLKRPHSFEGTSRAQDDRDPNVLSRTSLAAPPSQRPSVKSRALSIRSDKSGSLRRYASHQSGMTRHGTEQSFDATTVTDSDADTLSRVLEQPPHRMLRRRPGGDLRAARKVTDLDKLKRVRSTGSITVRSGSIIASVDLAGDSRGGKGDGDQSSEVRRRFSLGALADMNNKDDVSLMQTHSSQPNLRPSFESEVARLAQLPDDEEDGGIESTLLKLEGKFERRESDQSITRISPDAGADGNDVSLGLEIPDREGSDNVESDEGDQLRTAPNAATASEKISGDSTEILSEARFSNRELEIPIQLDSKISADRDEVESTRSNCSYSSTPILERGLSDRSLATSPKRSSKTAPPKFSSSESKAQSAENLTPSPPATGYLQSNGSVRVIPRRMDRSDATTTHESFLLDSDDPPESFLLDDDEDLSEFSSDLSMEENPLPSKSRPTFPQVTSRTIVSSIDPYLSGSHPPSPPQTGDTKQSIPLGIESDQFPRGLPTPHPSPIDKEPNARNIGSRQQAEKISVIQTTLKQGNSAYKGIPLHLPYILGHSSELLAEQFTLLEKDALNEVDWSELVELRSNEKPPDVRNWADYLRTHQPRGVDLVIARFNLVVKWTLSEIVMTRDLAERARTIIKYIHIASHARKLRNFATMYQLTTAMLSVDCSRLKRTWQLIPPTDVQTFKELSRLVQPIRNFYNLRLEMETATVGDGCIPFLGVYVHDLAFNSQRPAYIESTVPEQPLVNFERHRRTASIVKNVLRLLEASSKYNIQPVQGITDKCLWMASLSDIDIRSRSKQLEQ
ncbi:MAG: Guanine nucleotide exchange factor lte1 [Piccolia ochrophora]|nr:MAG: Guanine nucleotide exchange factor lte1 [Piccolia ochrophora]